MLRSAIASEAAVRAAKGLKSSVCDAKRGPQATLLLDLVERRALMSK